MNMVFAQLKKDLHCQRRPLILWLVSLLLGALPFLVIKALGQWQGKNLDFSNLTATQQMAGALSFAAIVMMAMSAAAFGMFLLLPILVTRLVHEDPLMGTTAFWQTRPIPRRKLLASKALFIGILLLPLVLTLGGNFRMGDSQFWLGMMAWIAAVAAIASITPGTGAWFGYGLSLFFGKIIFSNILRALWNQDHGPDPLLPRGMSSALISTKDYLHFNNSDFFHLCYLVGFSAVFIHQYLTLRTSRSLAICIVTLAMVGVLQMLAGQ